MPGDEGAAPALVLSPLSVVQPVGWQSLYGIGSQEATITAKALGRCPHCQQSAIWLPLGVDGALVGRAAFHTDVQLRGFGFEEPWGGAAESALGPCLFIDGKTKAERPPWIRGRRSTTLNNN